MQQHAAHEKQEGGQAGRRAMGRVGRWGAVKGGGNRGTGMVVKAHPNPANPSSSGSAPASAAGRGPGGGGADEGEAGIAGQWALGLGVLLAGGPPGGLH